MKLASSIGLLCLLAGSFLATIIQTSGGEVAVEDMRFTDADGRIMSALLYRPANATSETPAPGILAVHGYINSRETQSGYAIEFARRGFVVLALDQTGHGYSGGVAFEAGFGGPAGLQALRDLPFVDGNRIGLEGHSMGGWAVQMAALAHPDDYQAMVLQGSSTGTFGAPTGTPEFPRNLLLVFSEFDEFSQLMWGADTSSDIVSTEKLQTLFGISEDVQIGRLYGSLADGSARQLEMPPVTHPGDHISSEAIGAATDWFTDVLGAPLPKTDQVWIWKEIGTGLALLGLALLVFPFTSHMLRHFNVSWKDGGNEALLVQGASRFWLLAITILLPAVTFFPFQLLGQVIPPNSFFPQQITNGVLLWAILNGLISLTWLWFTARREDVSLRAGLNGALPAIKTAFTVFVAVYFVALMISEALTIDFRFWVVALKPLSWTQFGIFLCYLAPFTAFFLLLGMTFHWRLSWENCTERQAMFRTGMTFCAGYVALLALQYVPLFLTGSLLIDQPLLTIVAHQFVPVMFFVGAISAFCYSRTGSPWLGALLNGLLVSWYMVAGTATHTPPLLSQLMAG